MKIKICFVTEYSAFLATRGKNFIDGVINALAKMFSNYYPCPDMLDVDPGWLDDEDNELQAREEERKIDDMLEMLEEEL